VVISSVKSNKNWVILKRYSDFDALEKTIKPMFSNIPSLPGKTIFKLSQAQHLEERRAALNTYLKVSFHHN